MIAAIYARKSTDQVNVHEEEKSVHRQIEHAKDYAQQKGWTVTTEYIFQDDGISGAEFQKRPGFLRLMNALKPHPPFQVLVMSEESRLGREQIDTAYALKQIIDAGVQVFFYLEDKERTLDSALDKMMLSVASFASEMEREKAQQRTYDAMMKKAKAGHVTGGKVYGYDNEEVLASEPAQDGKSQRLHVVRRINPTQAAVVKHIFELYASGKGIQRIAKTLNAESVLPPRLAHGWAPSAIREMLYRPLYNGEIVWNQRQNIVKGGTKKRRKRPASEWIRVEAPDLRIVPLELWNAVHQRLEQAKITYVRMNTSGKLLGRPATRDFDSAYLLSGFTQCHECEGSLVAIRRSNRGKVTPMYGCLYHHKRGKTICSNGTVIRQDVLDPVVLQAITAALDDRILEDAVEKALLRLREGRELRVDQRTAIERDLSLIETKMKHLVDAIERGETTESLLARLDENEQQKKSLKAQLEGFPQNGNVISLDEPRLKREAKTRVKDIRSLLHRQVPQARQILRKLIVGKLQCEPVIEDGEKGYRITGQGTYGRFLPPTLVSTMVVPPRRFERPAYGLGNL